MRIERKNAQTLEDALMQMLKDARISSGHNTRRIFEAWDGASGAAQYTTRRFFRDGKLYITLSSSVARSQLYMQRNLLIEKMNALLRADSMFIQDDPNVSFVKELILK